MRNLIGVGILGMSLLLLSGCSSSIGEAKIKEIADEKLDIQNKRLAVVNDMTIATVKEKADKVGTIAEGQALMKKFQDLNPGDLSIYNTKFKPAVEAVEKQVAKALIPPKE